MRLIRTIGWMVLAVGAGALAGQSNSAAGKGQGTSGTGSPVNSTAGVQAVQAGQKALSATVGPTSQGPTAESYRGSLVTDKVVAGVLDLSIDDAVQRGLKHNLGLILQSSAEQNANGVRLQQLQQLLPTITGDANITVQQVNLAAFGLKFPGIKPIVGPFQVEDFRAYLTQSVVNVQALENYIAAKHNFAGAKLTAADARDLVVLTVGNAYLLCIADAARIDAVRAQMGTAQVSLKQANDAHEAGTSPKLDVLRAQVDLQNEQQQLIASTNDLAKDKIALARVIGLPLAQEFRLTDNAPYAALDNVDADAAFAEALKNRKDLAAADEQIKAARAQKTAAWAGQLPTATVSGDFGDLGTTVGHSHGTYTATAEVSAPILQIAKMRGDAAVANANYEQARARLSDEIQQVSQDVRSAVLDIQAAAKLVEATRSNVELATEALSEAQQRFKAGVSDTLAVSQAQTQARQANDQYISALYQHNVAKLALARAMGAAEKNYKTYLGGK